MYFGVLPTCTEDRAAAEKSAMMNGDDIMV
jgi:hypothetical protein